MRTVIFQVEGFVIGAIRTDMSDDKLLVLHSEWREEVPHPDTDSEFLEWLLDKHPEIEELECPTVLNLG
jgi:hypothetical protein